jgi:hypothetical protein
LLLGKCTYELALDFIFKQFPHYSDTDKFIKAITVSPYIFIFFFIVVYAVVFISMVVFSLNQKKEKVKKKSNKKLRKRINSILYLKKRSGNRNVLSSGIIIFLFSFSLCVSHAYFNIENSTSLLSGEDAENSYLINTDQNTFYQLGRNGHRVDYNVKVGAIVKITDSDLKDIIKFTGFDSRKPLFNIVYSNDSFANYGLPDSNYSKVYIDVDENKDTSQFDNLWNSIISNSSNTTSVSKFELIETIKENNRINNYIFRILILCFVLTGYIGVTIALKYYCYINNNRINLIYKLGANKQYIALYIIYDYIKMQIVAIIGSIAIMGILQTILNILSEKANEILRTQSSLTGKLSYIDQLILLSTQIFTLKNLSIPLGVTTLLICILFIVETVLYTRRLRTCSHRRLSSK